nr:MAG: hypothetical protein [Molluscum contagiosum virus]
MRCALVTHFYARVGHEHLLHGCLGRARAQQAQQLEKAHEALLRQPNVVVHGAAGPRKVAQRDGVDAAQRLGDEARRRLVAHHARHDADAARCVPRGQRVGQQRAECDAVVLEKREHVATGANEEHVAEFVLLVVLVVEAVPEERALGLERGRAVRAREDAEHCQVVRDERAQLQEAHAVQRHAAASKRAARRVDHQLHAVVERHAELREPRQLRLVVQRRGQAGHLEVALRHGLPVEAELPEGVAVGEVLVVHEQRFQRHAGQLQVHGGIGRDGDAVVLRRLLQREVLLEPRARLGRQQRAKRQQVGQVLGHHDAVHGTRAEAAVARAQRVRVEHVGQVGVLEAELGEGHGRAYAGRSGRAHVPAKEARVRLEAGRAQAQQLAREERQLAEAVRAGHGVGVLADTGAHGQHLDAVRRNHRGKVVPLGALQQVVDAQLLHRGVQILCARHVARGRVEDGVEGVHEGVLQRRLHLVVQAKRRQNGREQPEDVFRALELVQRDNVPYRHHLLDNK